MLPPTLISRGSRCLRFYPWCWFFLIRIFNVSLVVLEPFLSYLFCLTFFNQLKVLLERLSWTPPATRTSRYFILCNPLQLTNKVKTFLPEFIIISFLDLKSLVFLDVLCFSLAGFCNTCTVRIKGFSFIIFRSFTFIL